MSSEEVIGLPTMPSRRRFCRFLPVPLRSTLTVVVVVVVFYFVSCSSNGTAGCPGLHVCQPRVSQHHHPRSFGAAGVRV